MIMIEQQTYGVSMLFVFLHIVESLIKLAGFVLINADRSVQRIFFHEGTQWQMPSIFLKLIS